MALYFGGESGNCLSVNDSNNIYRTNELDNLERDSKIRKQHLKGQREN